MWLRIPTEIGEAFVGKDPRRHHDAEERIKFVIRDALADQASQKLHLTGKVLCEKFRAYEAECGIENPLAWQNYPPKSMDAWDRLATEIVEAVASNGRELSQIKLQTAIAIEELEAGKPGAALKALESVGGE